MQLGATPMRDNFVTKKVEKSLILLGFPKSFLNFITADFC